MRVILYILRFLGQSRHRRPSKFGPNLKSRTIFVAGGSLGCVVTYKPNLHFLIFKHRIFDFYNFCGKFSSDKKISDVPQTLIFWIVLENFSHDKKSDTLNFCKNFKGTTISDFFWFLHKNFKDTTNFWLFSFYGKNFKYDQFLPFSLLLKKVRIRPISVKKCSDTSYFCNKFSDTPIFAQNFKIRRISAPKFEIPPISAKF